MQHVILNRRVICNHCDNGVIMYFIFQAKMSNISLFYLFFPFGIVMYIFYYLLMFYRPND